MARAETQGLRIEVVYCPQPRHSERVSLHLDEGACLGDAVAASGLCRRHGLDAAELRIGIWGRVQALQTPLRDQDRVELYRPLKVDPKEARRLRYRRQKR
jgi:putative ubiquitin-RnfH superfamily antitoxin RatB of RatAB toxin-antitoxin module